ncbi:MAG: SGNH/GDSL hydrolase family protein [Endomicrobiaceae bacterium]|nr:SGNH/GDSL hydrolase family protein [Endomicrobiaceae bacterium]
MFLGLLLVIIVNIVFFESCPGYDFDINTPSENKTLGYELKKNLNYSGIKTNSSGFRDREFSILKNDKTKRILVLGDSLTLAVNINQQKNIFTVRLEDILNKTGLSLKYEVFNMGIDGYNTVQEAENLKRNGLKYNPDIVIVVYCLNDDDKDINDIYYASLFNKNRLNRLLFKSAVYRKIYLFFLEKFWIIKMHGQISRIDSKYKSMDFDCIGFEMFKDLQREYKFKLYVFIVPYFSDYKNYSDIKIHKRVTDRLKRYPEIRYFDLLEDFSRVTSDGKIFRHNNPDDFCHPNEKGHELIAEFMYNKLKQDGALN